MRKTTLLKVLAGELEYVKGDGNDASGVFTSGNPQIGFLKQTSRDRDGKTMLEEILDAYSDLLEIERKSEIALKDLEKDASEKNVKTYSALCERFEREGGYVYQKEYKTAVRKFGFSEEDLNKTLDTFSGGQRTKIALIKLLLSKPDVLLLDEPTNHLDLDAIEWLEKYLASYKKSCVIVSHDRMFLDKIVNTVYEIEYGETKRYSGNYTSFIEQNNKRTTRHSKTRCSAKGNRKVECARGKIPLQSDQSGNGTSQNQTNRKDRRRNRAVPFRYRHV